MFKKIVIDKFNLPCIILLVFVCLWGTSCASSRITVDESILEHQRGIELAERRRIDYERRIGEFDTLVREAVERLESIGRRASSIPEGISRIEFLLDELESEIQRLVIENNNLRTATESPEYSDFGVCYSRNPFLD